MSDREKIMCIRKKRRNKDLNGLGAILEQCAVQLRELGSHHKSFCFLSLKTKFTLRKFVCQIFERCKNPIRSHNRSKLLTKQKGLSLSLSLSLSRLSSARPRALSLSLQTHDNTVFPERCSGGLSRPRTLNHWGFGEDDP
jgi:hypothetical protein